MAQGPLTDTDYRELNRGLGLIGNTRESLLKGQQAGLPVEEPLAALDALEYQLTQLKKSFFPDKQ